MKKSRKWSLFVGGVAVVAVGAWGLSLNGASSTIDPAKVATVERGTTTRPVVATGKIEPITKVEIKSKANGIFENLFVDVDHLVTPGQVLAELDKENLTARLRDARADLQAAEPARAGALAQLRKKEEVVGLVGSLLPAMRTARMDRSRHSATNRRSPASGRRDIRCRDALPGHSTRLCPAFRPPQ